MSEIVDSWYYGNIGIVKVHDDTINVDKFYIGNILGINQEADEKYIKEWGMPFIPDLIK